mmetsp:Transcript_22690/g.57486  ORF Transcript_22690/g.57486 Transcript_22690/m.57486 type:complete len:2999 (+) Transcript_22690:72-9068(+)
MNELPEERPISEIGEIAEELSTELVRKQSLVSESTVQDIAVNSNDPSRQPSPGNSRLPSPGGGEGDAGVVLQNQTKGLDGVEPPVGGGGGSGGADMIEDAENANYAGDGAYDPLGATSLDDGAGGDEQDATAAAAAPEPSIEMSLELPGEGGEDEENNLPHLHGGGSTEDRHPNLIQTMSVDGINNSSLVSLDRSLDRSLEGYQSQTLHTSVSQDGHNTSVSQFICPPSELGLGTLSSSQAGGGAGGTTGSANKTGTIVNESGSLTLTMEPTIHEEEEFNGAGGAVEDEDGGQSMLTLVDAAGTADVAEEDAAAGAEVAGGNTIDTLSRTVRISEPDEVDGDGVAGVGGEDDDPLGATYEDEAFEPDDDGEAGGAAQPQPPREDEARTEDGAAEASAAPSLFGIIPANLPHTIPSGPSSPASKMRKSMHEEPFPRFSPKHAFKNKSLKWVDGPEQYVQKLLDVTRPTILQQIASQASNKNNTTSVPDKNTTNDIVYLLLVKWLTQPLPEEWRFRQSYDHFCDESPLPGRERRTIANVYDEDLLFYNTLTGECSRLHPEHDFLRLIAEMSKQAISVKTVAQAKKSLDAYTRATYNQFEGPFLDAAGYFWKSEETGRVSRVDPKIFLHKSHHRALRCLKLICSRCGVNPDLLLEDDEKPEFRKDFYKIEEAYQKQRQKQHSKQQAAPSSDADDPSSQNAGGNSNSQKQAPPRPQIRAPATKLRPQERNKNTMSFFHGASTYLEVYSGTNQFMRDHLEFVQAKTKEKGKSHTEAIDKIKTAKSCQGMFGTDAASAGQFLGQRRVLPYDPTNVYLKKKMQLSSKTRPRNPVHTGETASTKEKDAAASGSGEGAGGVAQNVAQEGHLAELATMEAEAPAAGEGDQAMGLHPEVQIPFLPPRPSGAEQAPKVEWLGLPFADKVENDYIMSDDFVPKYELGIEPPGYKYDLKEWEKFALDLSPATRKRFQEHREAYLAYLETQKKVDPFEKKPDDKKDDDATKKTENKPTAIVVEDHTAVMQVGSKKVAGGGAAPPPDEAAEDKSLAEAAAKLQQDITDVFEQEDDGTAPVSLVNAFPDTYNADYYDRGSSQSSAEESWTPALLVRDAIKGGVEEAFGPQVERTKALAPEEATEAAEEVVEEDAAGTKAEEDPGGAAAPEGVPAGDTSVVPAEAAAGTEDKNDDIGLDSMLGVNQQDLVEQNRGVSKDGDASPHSTDSPGSTSPVVPSAEPAAELGITFPPKKKKKKLTKEEQLVLLKEETKKGEVLALLEAQRKSGAEIIHPKVMALLHEVLANDQELQKAEEAFFGKKTITVDLLKEQSKSTHSLLSSQHSTGFSQLNTRVKTKKQMKLGWNLGELGEKYHREMESFVEQQKLMKRDNFQKLMGEDFKNKERGVTKSGQVIAIHFPSSIPEKQKEIAEKNSEVMKNRRNERETKKWVAEKYLPDIYVRVCEKHGRGSADASVPGLFPGQAKYGSPFLQMEHLNVSASVRGAGQVEGTGGKKSKKASNKTHSNKTTQPPSGATTQYGTTAGGFHQDPNQLASSYGGDFRESNTWKNTKQTIDIYNVNPEFLRSGNMTGEYNNVVSYYEGLEEQRIQQIMMSASYQQYMSGSSPRPSGTESASSGNEAGGTSRGGMSQTYHPGGGPFYKAGDHNLYHHRPRDPLRKISEKPPQTLDEMISDVREDYDRPKRRAAPPPPPASSNGFAGFDSKAAEARLLADQQQQAMMNKGTTTASAQGGGFTFARGTGATNSSAGGTNVTNSRSGTNASSRAGSKMGPRSSGTTTQHGSASAAKRGSSSSGTTAIDEAEMAAAAARAGSKSKREQPQPHSQPFGMDVASSGDDTSFSRPRSKDSFIKPSRIAASPYGKIEVLTLDNNNSSSNNASRTSSRTGSHAVGGGAAGAKGWSSSGAASGNESGSAAAGGGTSGATGIMTSTSSKEIKDPLTFGSGRVASVKHTFNKRAEEEYDLSPNAGDPLLRMQKGSKARTAAGGPPRNKAGGAEREDLSGHNTSNSRPHSGASRSGRSGGGGSTTEKDDGDGAHASSSFTKRKMSPYAGDQMDTLRKSPSREKSKTSSSVEGSLYHEKSELSGSGAEESITGSKKKPTKSSATGSKTSAAGSKMSKTKTAAGGGKNKVAGPASGATSKSKTRKTAAVTAPGEEADVSSGASKEFSDGAAHTTSQENVASINDEVLVAAAGTSNTVSSKELTTHTTSQSSQHTEDVSKEISDAGRGVEELPHVDEEEPHYSDNDFEEDVVVGEDEALLLARDRDDEGHHAYSKPTTATNSELPTGSAMKTLSISQDNFFPGSGAKRPERKSGTASSREKIGSAASTSSKFPVEHFPFPTVAENEICSPDSFVNRSASPVTTFAETETMEQRLLPFGLAEVENPKPPGSSSSVRSSRPAFSRGGVRTPATAGGGGATAVGAARSSADRRGGGSGASLPRPSTKSSAHSSSQRPGTTMSSTGRPGTAAAVVVESEKDLQPQPIIPSSFKLGQPACGQRPQLSPKSSITSDKGGSRKASPTSPASRGGLTTTVPNSKAGASNAGASSRIAGGKSSKRGITNQPPREKENIDHLYAPKNKKQRNAAAAQKSNVGRPGTADGGPPAVVGGEGGDKAVLNLPPSHSKQERAQEQATASAKSFPSAQQQSQGQQKQVASTTAPAAPQPQPQAQAPASINPPPPSDSDEHYSDDDFEQEDAFIQEHNMPSIWAGDAGIMFAGGGGGSLDLENAPTTRPNSSAAGSVAPPMLDTSSRPGTSSMMAGGMRPGTSQSTLSAEGRGAAGSNSIRPGTSGSIGGGGAAGAFGGAGGFATADFGGLSGLAEFGHQQLSYSEDPFANLLGPGKHSNSADRSEKKKKKKKEKHSSSSTRGEDHLVSSLRESRESLNTASSPRPRTRDRGAGGGEGGERQRSSAGGGPSRQIAEPNEFEFTFDPEAGYDQGNFTFGGIRHENSGGSRVREGGGRERRSREHRRDSRESGEGGGGSRRDAGGSGGASRSSRGMNLR